MRDGTKGLDFAPRHVPGRQVKKTSSLGLTPPRPRNHCSQDHGSMRARGAQPRTTDETATSPGLLAPEARALPATGRSEAAGSVGPRYERGNSNLNEGLSARISPTTRSRLSSVSLSRFSRHAV